MSNEPATNHADAPVVSSEETTLREARRLLSEVAEERRQLRAENARLIAEIAILNYNLQDEAHESTAWCKLAHEVAKECDALRAMEAALPTILERACEGQRFLCVEALPHAWKNAAVYVQNAPVWRKETGTDD
jgi:hypothetical protein